MFGRGSASIGSHIDAWGGRWDSPRSMRIVGGLDPRWRRGVITTLLALAAIGRTDDHSRAWASVAGMQAGAVDSVVASRADSTAAPNPVSTPATGNAPSASDLAPTTEVPWNPPEA